MKITRVKLDNFTAFDKLDLALSLQADEHSLDDLEGHPSQGGNGLVVVLPVHQVHLPDGLQAEAVIDVHEHAYLDAVPREEGDLLQQLAGTPVLPGQGLDEGTQVRNMILEESLLGRQVDIRGQFQKLNLGDNSGIKS